MNLNDAFAPIGDAPPNADAGKAASDWTPIMPVPDDAPKMDKDLAARFAPPGFTFTKGWPYLDANDQLLGAVARYDRPANGVAAAKEFRPLTYCERDGRREWRPKGFPDPRPLYRLPKLAKRSADPVLVVEGEKTVTAAEKLFADYVVTTSPGGAQAVRKADWSPLFGRNVVIWPDHDQAGADYAAAVVKELMEVGAASVAVVEVPDSFPDAWDLADPEPDGADLAALLNAAKPIEADHADAADDEEGDGLGYVMRRDGLWWLERQKSERIAGPFTIAAQTRDEQSDGWGLLIEWRDADGKPHSWAMPRAMLASDGAAIRERLLDGGLYIAPTRTGRDKLMTYLAQAQPADRVRAVDKAGWTGDVYVTASETFGAQGRERVAMQISGKAPDYDLKGDPDAWKREVAALAVGNSRLALALSMAFAGPLLSLVGEDSFGIHFAGGSSGGKTTALRVAASAWGAPIRSWRTTDNASEGWAVQANDGLLILDELSQVDGRAADAMSYMLGNGGGKGRMTKSGVARPTASWRLAFLSTGEVGLTEKLGEAGRKPKAGQSVRMIEVPADAGKGLKLFDELHGFDGGDALARHLRAATDKHVGHAARAFLTAITKDPKAVAAGVKAARDEWLNEHLPQGADGQVSRVAARFGLIAAAGELASGLQVLPWPDGEASGAAARCFNDWLRQRGGVGAAEIQDGVAAVKAFIEANGASRFSVAGGEVDPGANDQEKTINRVGYKRKVGERWEYFVFTHAWKDIVCAGFNADAVADAMIAQGLMVGSQGRRTVTVKISGLGKPRVYRITPDILDAEGGDHA